MKKINVIFLDIDGVLNEYKSTSKSPRGYTGVDDDKIELLASIVQLLDAEIVLTSDWKFENCNGETPCLDYLRDKLSEHGLKILDYTKDKSGLFNRGQGILEWINEDMPEDTDISKYVIFDDKNFDFECYDEIKDHVIHTDFMSGGIFVVELMSENATAETLEVYNFINNK